MDSAEFHAAVYHVVRQIPPQKVTSYGHIAKLIGMPSYSRHVGQALKFLSPNVNPPVPWHRVLAASGTIVISHDGARRQRDELQADGVEVTEGRTGDLKVNMRLWGWFPAVGTVDLGDYQLAGGGGQEEEESDSDSDLTSLSDESGGEL